MTISGDGKKKRELISVQFSSVAQLCLTLCDPMDCSTPGLPIHHQLLELTQIHVHWVEPRSPVLEADTLTSEPPGKPICPLSQWCHPTISSSVIPFSSHLQSSQHLALFQWFCSLYQVAKYWSFNFSISSSKEHPGLISFRMDWLDLLAVQETLRRLHHHSSKASVLWHSAFFMVQLSHPYMTTGKTIALTRRTFKFASLNCNS